MEQHSRKYTDPTSRDWIIGIGLLVLFLILIGISGVFLLPEHWLWWLFLVFGGTSLLTLNQTKNYACRCRTCGFEFEIKFLTNLTSPHGIDKLGSWLYVRCPSCKSRGKVSVIRIAKNK